MQHCAPREYARVPTRPQYRVVAGQLKAEFCPSEAAATREPTVLEQSIELPDRVLAIAVNCTVSYHLEEPAITVMHGDQLPYGSRVGG